MGKLTNLNPPVALTTSDMPSAMATDAELAAAFNAHLEATDPHGQYLLPSEADAKYWQKNTAFFTSVSFPPASVTGNSIALSWNSVQPGQGIAEFCNFAGLGGGDAFNFFRMQGNATSPPSISNRVGRIDVVGAYVQVSDRRLKSHFSPAPGLEAVMALKPLKYTHWACSGFDEKKQSLTAGKFFALKIGFLAQDVQEVIPEAVPIPVSKEEPLGIDYNCLLACAIAAIQELQEQINKLRSQLNTKA